MYYEDSAEEYFAATVSADMADVRRRFVKLLPPGGRILDAGCGSGRDLRAFKTMGFQATGIDESQKLAKLAGTFSGVPCYAMRIEDMAFKQQFDGIWACASLLHAPKCALPSLLIKLRDALLPNSILFASVKFGTGEYRDSDGRHFSLYEPVEFRRAIEAAYFHIIDCWTSTDVLSERMDVQWINVIARANRA